MTSFVAQPQFAAIFTLAVIAGMFVLFIRETYPPEVTAMIGSAVLLVAGVLPSDQLLDVFANPAPWTIAAMFILSGGLVRTGILSNISRIMTRHAGRSPARTLAAMAVLVLVSSAFMNNTPIVVVMLPITIQLAQSINVQPSKLLIPLSYTTILGGLCTLIGTSTNLLVDGVARKAGLEPFSLFEITSLGVPVAIIGLIYLRIFVPRLLPDRDSMADMLGGRKKMKFFTEVVVPEGSPLIGQQVMQVAPFKRDGMRVIDVLRGEESLRRQFPEVALEEGDRVVLRTEMQELLGLKDNSAVNLVDRVGSRGTTTVEALVSPDCKLVGRSLGSLRLRRRYGVYTLAVHRRNQNIGRQLDEVVVRVGDTLLLEGAPEDIRRLSADVDLVDIAAPTERPYRRELAPLMVGILVAVVGLSAFEVAPIHILALLAVVVVLVTGVLDADEVFSFVDARLLALIFAMLSVGLALDEFGRGDDPRPADGADPARHAAAARGGDGLSHLDGADRAGDQQCRCGRRHAHSHCARPPARRRSAAAGGGGDDGRLGELLDADRLPDQHAGLRAWRLQVHRLLPHRHSHEHPGLALHQHDDSADLAARGLSRRPAGRRREAYWVCMCGAEARKAESCSA